MSVATLNLPTPLSQNVTEKTLNELLHLALRSPEVGSVNFNILHTLLASILQQLDLQNSVVQLPTCDISLSSEHSSDEPKHIEQLVNKLTNLEVKVDKLHESPNSLDSNARVLEELQRKVVLLEEKLQSLISFPTNEEIIEKSKTGNVSATEVWQQMQLQKKTEANTAGVSRALSLIDDLMREMNKMKEGQEKMQNDIEEINKRLEKAADMSDVLNRLTAVEAYKSDIIRLQTIIDELKLKLDNYPSASEFDNYITWPVLEEALTQHMAKMEALQRQKEEEELVDDFPASPHRTPASSRPASSRLSSAKEKFPQATEMLEKIGALSELHIQLDGRVVVLEEAMPGKQDKLDLEELLHHDVPEDLLAQLKQLREAIDALEQFKDQEDSAIRNLQNAVLNFQAELEKLQALVQAAMDEHQLKQKHIDSLYGFVEKLEDVKANKDVVRMEIDVKADKRLMATKVNQGEFDNATGELTRNLDELIKKVILQEEEWQKANKQISADVDLKLDRAELEAIKQNLDSRLKALKKLLDRQPVAQSEDDAAGFRKQLIHNYHCISCDRAVELTPAGPVASIPANSALPPSKFVRPYTSYELDQLRNQARGDDADMDSMMPSGRPCGGSYTLTFPHRRYTRISHLSDLWQQEEEEVVANVGKEEVELQGHNGQIYRGRLPNISIPESNQYRTFGGPRSGISPRPNSARQRNPVKTSSRRPLSSGCERNETQQIPSGPPQHSTTAH